MLTMQRQLTMSLNVRIRFCKVSRPLALRRSCTTCIVYQVIQVIQVNQSQKTRPVTVKRKVMKRVMLSVLNF